MSRRPLRGMCYVGRYIVMSTRENGTTSNVVWREFWRVFDISECNGNICKYGFFFIGNNIDYEDFPMIYSAEIWGQLNVSETELDYFYLLF